MPAARVLYGSRPSDPLRGHSARYRISGPFPPAICKGFASRRTIFLRLRSVQTALRPLHISPSPFATWQGFRTGAALAL